MNILCPNRNDEAYKALQNALGERTTYDIFYRMGNELPTMEDVPGVIESESTVDKKAERLNSKEAYKDIMNKLQNPHVEKLTDEHVYVNKETGERYDNNVTGIVNQVQRKQGNHFRGEDNPFYGHKGTVIHSYLENIGKALVEGRTPSQKEVQTEVFKLLNLDEFSERNEEFMRMRPNDFTTLVKGMRKLVGEINALQRDIDPDANAKFYFEVPIADDIASVAGTIDLAVLFSDGSMGVYDYKSFRDKGKQAPHPKSRDKWAMQMGRYKSILRDMYGVQTFRQSRVIPIQISYDKMVNGEWVNEIEEGFQKVAMQSEQDRKTEQHLDAIPLEELTGDPAVDELIKKLLDQKAETKLLLKRAKTGEKTRLLNKLSRIDNSLKNVQLNRDISGMANDVITLYKQYKGRLNLNPNDSKYMSYRELTDAISEMDLYVNLASDYRDQLDNITDKKERQAKGSSLSTAESRAKYLKEKLLDELVLRVGTETLKAGEIPSAAARQFQGIQDWNHPTFQRLNELIRDADEMARRKTMDEFERIQDIDEAFSKWAKNNGYSPMGKFELLYNDKNGKLYSQYSDDFWKKKGEIVSKARKKKNLTKEEKQWLEKYFKFDQAEYERQKEQRFEQIEHDLETISDYTPERAKEEKQKFLNRYSVERNPANFYKAKSDFLVPNEDTASEYFSEEWKFIKANKPVKDYYDMYVDYNLEWGETFGKGVIGRNFIANVRKGLWDNMVEFGPKGLGDLANVYKNSLEIHEQDELLGSEGDTIPLLYTDTVYNDPSASQKKRIEEEVATIMEPGTDAYNKEVATRISELGRELGLKTKSKDLTKSLMAMVYSANTHISKSAIEGEVKALQTLIDTNRVESFQLSQFEENMVRKAEGDLIKKIGLDPDLKEYFDSFVDMLLYGKKIKSDKKLGKYSASKIMGQMMNYMSVRSLGLNHTIQIADYIQGKTSMSMMASEGRYFTKKGWKETLSEFGRKDEQLARVAEFWQPESRSIPSEKIELAGATQMSRKFRQRTMFIGYIWSDDNISKGVLSAMAKHYVIDSDGKIKNSKLDKADIKDENAPTVFESVKEKDGQLYIEGLEVKEFAKFRDKVQKMLYQIRGTQNERQKGLFSRMLLGPGLQQFRTWIPGLAQARFGALRYDATMESIERGRFGVAMAEVVHSGFLPAVTETLKIISEAVTMGLYKRQTNEAAVDRIMTKFLDNHPQYKKEFKGPEGRQKFIQLHKDKMHGFIAEMRIYMAFFVTVQLLGGLEWDDDEEGNLFTWNAHQIARRALLEASFFWNPSSVDEIIRSPLPLWGQLLEFKKMAENGIVEVTHDLRGIEDTRDETPLGYYTLKNIPAVNQILDIFDYFNRYNPPKNAIEKALSTPGEE